MTAEEVRNQLEELIRDRESFMVGDYDKDIYDRDKEALEFAVKAVEKQIPQKPQNATYFYGGKYSCQGCSKALCFDFDEQKEYCPECGQALDWSDENEEDTDAV